MKTNKPRNYVALAMMKRNGSGAHVKPNKSKRQQQKIQLRKELREPPTYPAGGFLFAEPIIAALFATMEPKYC